MNVIYSVPIANGEEELMNVLEKNWDESVRNEDIEILKVEKEGTPFARPTQNKLSYKIILL